MLPTRGRPTGGAGQPTIKRVINAMATVISMAITAGRLPAPRGLDAKDRMRATSAAIPPAAHK